MNIRVARLSMLALICLSVLGSVLITAPVGAQATDTNTPTITVTAPPMGGVVTTGTIGSVGSLNCPEGTPSGWGSVTPGPLWDLLCSSCSIEATPSPYPTFDYGILQTQAACQTVSPGGEECYWPTAGTPGTPTNTVTPLPTGTMAGQCGSLTQTALPTNTPSGGSWTAHDDGSFSATVSGAWNGSSATSSGAYNNTIWGISGTAYVANTSWQVSFTGVSVRFYSREANNRGKLNVYIDGSSVATGVDLYSSTTSETVLEWTGTGLTDTTHTLKLEQANTKNGSSSGYYVNVDRVDTQSAVYATNTPWGVPGAVSCDTGGVPAKIPCSQYDDHTLRYDGDGIFEHKGMGLTPSGSYYVTVVVPTGGIVSADVTTIDLKTMGSASLDSFPVESCGSECTQVVAGTYQFGPVLSDADGYEIGQNSMAGITIHEGVTIWITQSRCVQAATPTGVPGGSGFCETVQGGGDNGFSYSGITYGSKSCIDIGPFDWSSVLPAWIPTQGLPTVPWIAHVCFQDMDIGTIQIFAVSFSLQTFAFIMGVVSIIIIAVSK